MKKSIISLLGTGLFTALISFFAQAADQTWNDADANNIWNLANTNWEFGSTWTNGNNAIFGGTGETVELDADISVANLSFNTSGYEITDANADGSFSIAGNPTVITVATNCTAKLSDEITGSGGFTKEGPGTLELTVANSFSGVTRINEGILKLADDVPDGLGATGTGNELIIESGAALDLNSAYNLNRAQHITASGAGVNGSGAIFNSSGNVNYNTSFGNLTLTGDTTISVGTRWDFCRDYTVYGNNFTLTKIGGSEIAVSRAVINCPIVVNAGTWTVQHAEALGANDYDTWINDSRLFVWGNHTLAEHIYFSGTSSLGEGSSGANAKFTGHLTVNNTLNIYSSNDAHGVEIPAYIDGPGGLTKTGAGWCYITCNTNSYAGATQVNSSRKLWVGKNDGSSTTGRLGPGPITVNGDLYFDVANTTTISNTVSGVGTIRQRYDNELILSGFSSSSSPGWIICDGTLTLTNNTSLNTGTRDFTLSDRQSGDYPVDPSNTFARLTITEGCSLTAKAFICGNGINYSGTSMTSIVNQVGGTITSTGHTDQDNGFRMAHYPGARTTWTISGGVMNCQNNWDLCMATDGYGWFRVTGGEVNTTRIMVKERDYSTSGYGHLTICGGVVNIGTTDPSVGAITNAIATDLPSRTQVEFGGCEDGGEIRAVTNIYITVDATLEGSNENAITFNSNGHTIYFSGLFSGTGGFNLIGGGTMDISSVNSFDGEIRITDGSTLLLSANDAVPNATIYVEAGATLNCGGFSQTTAGIYGPGAVINRPGTLIILF